MYIFHDVLLYFLLVGAMTNKRATFLMLAILLLVLVVVFTLSHYNARCQAIADEARAEIRLDGVWCVLGQFDGKLRDLEAARERPKLDLWNDPRFYPPDPIKTVDA